MKTYETTITFKNGITVTLTSEGEICAEAAFRRAQNLAVCTNEILIVKSSLTNVEYDISEFRK